MINISIILLLSLVAYVACGGGREPPNMDGTVVWFSDNEDDSRAPLILTGESSELLNEDKPIREDSHDEAHDDGSVSEWHNNDGTVNDFLDDDYNSDPSEDSDDELYEAVTMPINCGPGSIRMNNSGAICGDAGNSLNGAPIDFQGDTLFIGGIKIQGVNASERPLVLKWGKRKLHANEIRQTDFDGIQGTGTWSF